MIAIRWGLAILAVGLALPAGAGAEAAIYESSLHQMTAGDVQTIGATAWVSTNSVGPGYGTFDPTNGQFELLTLTGRSHEGISGNLIIRLSSLNGSGNNWQTFFDDVQLTARFVPEPSSIAILGLGALPGIPIVLRRLRRRVIA